MKNMVTGSHYKRIRLWRYLSVSLSIYTVVFIGLIIAYILLAYIPRPAAAALRHYNLSNTGYYWLISTIMFLIILIAAAGLYGSLQVRAYWTHIRNSQDGRPFNSLSYGFLVLSISLPLTSVLSSVVGHIVTKHTSWLPTLTIINNYIALALTAAAFVLIAKGSEGLYHLARRSITPLPQRLWVFAFIVASSVYTYFVLRETSQGSAAAKAYFLPTWLQILTITIPYLYFWYRGLSAAYNILTYQKNIKGRLYKSALNYLAAGITMVIISLIATRVLFTLTPNLSRLSLTPILFIIYGLLLIDASGYFLIAVGAKKLRQIEEV